MEGQQKGPGARQGGAVRSGHAGAREQTPEGTRAPGRRCTFIPSAKAWCVRVASSGCVGHSAPSSSSSGSKWGTVSALGKRAAKAALGSFSSGTWGGPGGSEPSPVSVLGVGLGFRATCAASLCKDPQEVGTASVSSKGKRVTGRWSGGRIVTESRFVSCTLFSRGVRYLQNTDNRIHVVLGRGQRASPMRSTPTRMRCFRKVPRFKVRL